MAEPWSFLAPTLRSPLVGFGGRCIFTDLLLDISYTCWRKKSSTNTSLLPVKTASIAGHLFAKKSH